MLTSLLLRLVPNFSTYKNEYSIWRLIVKETQVNATETYSHITGRGWSIPNDFSAVLQSK